MWNTWALKVSVIEHLGLAMWSCPGHEFELIVVFFAFWTVTIFVTYVKSTEYYI